MSQPDQKEISPMSDTAMLETTADLRAWAKGMYGVEAAVELLVRAFDGRFARPGNAWIQWDEGRGRHWLDADAIMEHTGALSGGERRLLDVVASLAASDPVALDLSEVAGIDRKHLSLVLAAIAHAGGSHQQSEITIDYEAGVSRRGPRLPSLYPWPES